MATKEKHDTKTFNAVVERAMDMFKRHETPVDEQTLRMDLLVTDTNCGGLDFKGLLDATPFDFSHDIVGIVENMDRANMKLGNCFTPRYSLNK